MTLIFTMEILTPGKTVFILRHGPGMISTLLTFNYLNKIFDITIHADLFNKSIFFTIIIKVIVINIVSADHWHQLVPHHQYIL